MIDFSMVRTDADIWLPNERNNFSPLSSSFLSSSPLSPRLSPFSTRSSSPNYQYREGIIYVNLYKKFTLFHYLLLNTAFRRKPILAKQHSYYSAKNRVIGDWINNLKKLGLHVQAKWQAKCIKSGLFLKRFSSIKRFFITIFYFVNGNRQIKYLKYLEKIDPFLAEKCKH